VAAWWSGDRRRGRSCLVTGGMKRGEVPAKIGAHDARRGGSPSEAADGDDGVDSGVGGDSLSAGGRQDV
jgi:hypothetical protein